MANQHQSDQPTPENFLNRLQQPNPARPPAEQREMDAQATQMLLDYHHQDDGWHCPRCEQVFTDPHAFADHLKIELVKSWAVLKDITPRPKPPRENPHPPK